MSMAERTNAPPTQSTWHWDGDVVHLALVGRLRGADVELMAACIEEAMRRLRRFAVVFDQRQLGAPSAMGQTALQGWNSGPLTRVGSRCAGWADVFDERRWRSLTHDGELKNNDRGFRYRSFGDMDEAVAWANQQLH
jgi:hypothetical protein